MRNYCHIVVCCLFAASLAGSCGTAGHAHHVESSPSDEMVDIGYESTRRGDLSYSVSSMKPEDNEKMSYSNMYDYLRGRVAGVEVGPDNTPSSIRIRGVNSINSSTAPLIMVDGIEADLGSINPYDVYSVSVLKDSSASIYGVRGANGVILITTKQAQQLKEEQAQAKKAAKAEKKAAKAARKQAK